MTKPLPHITEEELRRALDQMLERAKLRRFGTIGGRMAMPTEVDDGKADGIAPQ